MRTHLRWIPLFLYLGLLTWGSLASADTMRSLPRLGWDKALHALAYAGVCSMVLFALTGYRASVAKRYWGTLVFAILYGALMEVGQARMFRGRTPELYDILANTIGAGIYLIVFYFWETRWCRRDVPGTPI